MTRRAIFWLSLQWKQFFCFHNIFEILPLIWQRKHFPDFLRRYFSPGMPEANWKRLSLLVYFDIVKSQKVWIKMHLKKFFVSQWTMSVPLPSPTFLSLFWFGAHCLAIYAVIELTNFCHRNFIRLKTFEHVFSVSNPAEGLGGISRLLEALGNSTSTLTVFCTLR